MTPRQIANDVAELAADRIGQAIRDRRDWMRNHPYIAYRFHHAMAIALPSWRWLARRWHYSQARRARALWEASDDADRCRAAEAMGR